MFSAPPVIIGMHNYNDTLSTFSIIYFAKPPPNVPQWFKYTTLLMNSSRFSILNENKKTAFKIYGKLTQQTVYSSNLSMNELIPGSYTVMVSNEYGHVRTTFIRKPGNKIQLGKCFFYLSIE